MVLSAGGLVLEMVISRYAPAESALKRLAGVGIPWFGLLTERKEG